MVQKKEDFGKQSKVKYEEKEGDKEENWLQVMFNTPIENRKARDEVIFSFYWKKKVI